MLFFTRSQPIQRKAHILYSILNVQVKCMVCDFYLSSGPVVVQPGEAGEVSLGDGWCRLGAKESIGICRVAYNQHLQEIKFQR